jgi:HSP20 family molecular chaperone IbpA
MNTLARYHSANLPELMKIIQRNGIGMDDYLDRFFNSYETTTNYPPYNLIQVNNVESVLEIALAGFTKNTISVYTEYGKLIVEGQKETKETGSEYVHQGLAQRSFTREWALSDDVEVREVQFKDGLLTVKLGKVVPEHHARKDYLK